MNFDLLLSQTSHFDKKITLPFLVLATLGFLLFFFSLPTIRKLSIKTNSSCVIFESIKVEISKLGYKALYDESLPNYLLLN